jgi:hypothetical protein
MAKYKIKKGRHYHSNFFQRLNFLNLKRNLGYTVEFDTSCWYPEEKVNNLGYNKLFGMGSVNPKKNSARIVWLPDFEHKNQFRLYAYAYENKNRLEVVYLTNVQANKKFRAEVRANGSHYAFRLDEFQLKQPHGKVKRGIRLQPYFGGRDKAYQTMFVRLDK